MKPHVAVADMAAGKVRCLSEPFDCAIFLAGPCVNNGHVSDERCTLDGILANRCQLDRAFAFANRILLIPEHGIDDTQRAKCSRVIRLVPDRLTKFLSRAVQRRSSTRLIAAQLGKKTLAPAAREWNIFVKASTASYVG